MSQKGHGSSGLAAEDLTEKFGAGEVQGGDGEGGPDDAAEGEGDDVAGVGLLLVDEMEEQIGSGEADDCGGGGAEDFGAIEAA